MKTSTRIYIVLVALLALTALSGQAIAQPGSDPKSGPNNDNPVVHQPDQLPGETCIGAGGVNCPAPIPDSGGGDLVSNFDAISCGGGFIEDVNIGVDIIHTFIGDLDVTVTSPAGTSVQVFNGACGSDDDMQAIWDDEGVPNPCPVVGFGNWLPTAPLSALDGELGDGNWSLTITDNFGGDVGELLDWSVEMTCSGPIPTMPTYGLAALAALLALVGLAALAVKRRSLSH